MPMITPRPDPAADTAETRRVFERFWGDQSPHPPTDAWKQEMADLFEEFVAPNVVLHDVPMTHDRQSWLDFTIALRTANPEAATTWDMTVVDGDIGMSQWTYRGTSRASLGDHAPTGRSFEVRGALCSRVADGKIVEHWAVIDKLSWLKQLGAIDEALDL